MKRDQELRERLFRQMVLIRRFEETVSDLFSKGLLFGTTHCYIGQEAIAVGIINAISRKDIVTSNHRGHGHFIAFTDDVEGLMAELMGKSTGVCGGRGGSQHLHKGNFYSNGVTGGMVPVATGMAMAEKFLGSKKIVVCFLGDGALNQGVVYESWNMASLWGLPVLYVVENNLYAMSTHISQHLAGSTKARPEAFGVETHEITSNDVEEIHGLALTCVSQVRGLGRPVVMVCNTYRLCGHSKSDDCCYRSREEEKEWEKHDPPKILSERLDEQSRQRIIGECEERIESALTQARRANFADPKSLDEFGVTDDHRPKYEGGL